MSTRTRIDVRENCFAEVTVGYDNRNDIISENGTKVTRGDWTLRIIRSSERSIISVCHAENPEKNRTFTLKNGTVFLDSYAYFRNAYVMRFMDEFGLTGFFANTDPNRDYKSQLPEAVDRTPEIEVWSDGTTANLGEDAYKRDVYCVSGANWVICSERFAVPVSGSIFMSEERYSRILYTTEKNPLNLAPALRKAGVPTPCVGKAMIG